MKFTNATLEKDATVGGLTDGDFGGGGTDRTGNRIAVSYKVDGNTSLAIGHRIDQTAVEDGKDFQLTQIDLKFKF